MDAGIQTTSLPSSVAEFGDIKGAAQEPITFNKNVVRVTYSVEPDKPKAMYTAGNNIEFSLKTYDAQYINFVKSYLICDVKYDDPVTNYTIAPDAIEAAIGEYFHLCAPLHGSHSFFKKITIKVGSRVLQEKDNCDLINDVQMALSAKDDIYDETCGYYNPDSMWEDYTDPFTTPTEAIIPLESLIDDVPYLAEYNLHKPITIRLEVNSDKRLFGPCLTPGRINLMSAQTYPANTTGQGNEVTITPIADATPHIQISNIRLVMEGLRTTDQSNLDLVPQEWHSLISDSGTVSDALGTSKVDISIPIQKSSIKYIAMVKVPVDATDKVYPTGYKFEAYRSELSSTHLQNVATLYCNQDTTSCNLDAWPAWDINSFHYKIAGRNWPTDFKFESDKQVYMEILKEFHNYSMQGTSDAPMLKEHSSMHDTNYEIINSNPCQLSLSKKIGDISYNEVNTFSKYSTGYFIGGLNDYAVKTCHPQKQIMFTSFSKFIEQGKSIIGALDSESRNIIVKVDTDKDLNKGNFSRRGLAKDNVPCNIYYVVWYDAIVKLDSQVGSIDIFL